MVDTKTTKDFRVLNFNSGQDVIREAERIVAAEKAGTLRRSGNWTTGQMFAHIATWIEFALDGYPPNVKPPLPVKLFIRTFMRKKFFEGPMPRGVKIPKMPGGTLGADSMSTEAGFERLRRAWERLSTTPPTNPNVLFGPLSHDKWIKMNLRHTELHFGYWHP